MIFFFDPTVLVVLLLFFVIGGASAIFSALPSIISMCIEFCIIVAGFFLMITVQWGKSIPEKIARFLRGIAFVTVTAYILFLTEIGRGTEKVTEAKYVLLEALNVENKNQYFIYLIFTLIMLGIICVPSIIANLLYKKYKPMAKICSVFSIIIMCAVYIVGFKLAVDDSRRNSYDSFDYEMEKYEVISDADIYLEVAMLKTTLFKIGTVKSGQKLYENKQSFEKDGEIFYQVTDGKKVMGYVSSKYLKSLYESSYALNVDAPMYGIIKYDSYRFHNVSGEMRPFNYEASDNIICTLPVETEVEKGNAVYNPTDFNESYSEIILPDGTRGCVLSKNLKKIKKVIP